MPASKTTATRTSAASKAQDDVRRLDQISETLELAQKDVSAIGASLGTGARELRRDVAKLLRDAHRDVGKLRRSLQRDLDRLQKDLTKTPARRRSNVRQGAGRS